MGAVQTVFTYFHEVHCCHNGCGVPFMLEQNFQNRRREDRKGFYCPNGHIRYYTGPNEAERLKKELEQEKRKTEWVRNDRDYYKNESERIERKARAYKGIVTKTKNRVGRGVCPCCNRTFQNLMDHMATQHPTYKDAK